MGDTFFENLFYKQEKQFEKINDLSKAFAVNMGVYLCEEGYDFLVCEYRTANV